MNDQYVHVPESLLKDQSLSLKAKGIYALILSLPLHWQCSIEELLEVCIEGRHVVRQALLELEKRGYLERREMRDHGRIAGMEYILKAQRESG